MDVAASRPGPESPTGGRASAQAAEASRAAATAEGDGTVAVAFDGSGCSWHALWWAAAAAELRWSTLLVVHVADDGATRSGPPGPTGLALVAAGLASVEGRGMLPAAVEARSGRGEPVDVLLGQSAGADLLVIGRGEGRRSRARPLGSVSRRCASSAHTPVAIVDERPTHPGEVVVGFDGSPDAAAAVAWGLAEAVRRAQRLVVVHGWAEPVAEGGMVVDRRFDRSTRGDAERAMAVAVTRASALVGRRPPDVDLRFVAAPATDALVASASEAGCVVVGRQRLTGAMAAGEGLLDRAGCPVVVVPPPVPPDHMASEAMLAKRV